MVLQSGRALNIAHGGALDPSWANTIEGICDSIASGVDAIEVDVQVTRDREPVLFHDSVFYVNERQIRISDLSLCELAAVNETGQGHPIPLLKDVLDRLRSTRILVLLDIKSQGIIDDVMRVIQAAHAEDKAWIASFDYAPLIRVKELYPKIPTILTVGFSRVMANPLGFLWTLFALLFPRCAAALVRANVILCPAFRVTHRLVRSAHQQKIAVFVWQLKDNTQVGYLSDYNVDGLVIDWPATLSRNGGIGEGKQ
jgi:glycerophosphoryl diester phosphodiesterase